MPVCRKDRWLLATVCRKDRWRHSHLKTHLDPKKTKKSLEDGPKETTKERQVHADHGVRRKDRCMLIMAACDSVQERQERQVRADHGMCRKDRCMLTMAACDSA
eukprot:1139749-Pelagomonas_calceolata.AAC.3